MASKKRGRSNLIGILIFLILAYLLIYVVTFGSKIFNIWGVLSQQKELEKLQKNGKIGTAIIDSITFKRSPNSNTEQPHFYVKMTFQPEKSGKKYTYTETFNPYIWNKNIKKGNKIKVIYNPKNPAIFRVAETLNSQISIRHSLYKIFSTILNVILILIILMFLVVIFPLFKKKKREN